MEDDYLIVTTTSYPGMDHDKLTSRIVPSAKGGNLYVVDIGGVSFQATNPQHFLEIAKEFNKCAGDGLVGWVSWAGGECPVAKDVMVEMEFKDGSVERDYAGNWCWLHRWGSADIIAYRIIQTARSAAE